MIFMTAFRQSMEEKILKTNVNIEEKIQKMDDKLDDRLNDINVKMDDNLEHVELEMQKLNSKLEDNMDVAERMEKRMDKLEEEMKRSEEIRKKTTKLKKIQDNLQEKPDGRKENEDQPNRNKSYNRQRIEPTDLVDESEDRDRDRDHVSGEGSGSFRSTWAKEVEEEMRMNAARGNVKRSNRREAGESGESEQRKEKDSEMNDHEREKDKRKDSEKGWEIDRELEWEILQPTIRKEKVRRPIVPEHWFGDEDSSGTDDGSIDSNWTEIERRKRGEEKRRKTRTKRKQKIEETLTKARSMVGIGPVTREILEKIDATDKDKEMVRKEIVEEMLKFHLDFNQEEIEILDIKETQEGKENLIYFAAGGQGMIREIYVRKAESRNDDLKLRNFIPPQLYKRYIAISNICKMKREENSDLKTQLRFGIKDIEVFTKWKGKDEGFKKTNLQEFLGEESIPNFEHDIKWKKKVDRPERRIPNYRNRTGSRDRRTDETPTTGNNDQNDKTMVRQRSTTEENDAKRLRVGETSSDIEMDESPANRKSSKPVEA